MDDGLITEQLYPEIIKAALPVVGRSGDILRPELKQVKDSVKQMIKNEGFSIPWGTEDQVALLAMMFGGQPTKYPGVTDVGMNFFRHHGNPNPSQWPNSAEGIREKNKQEKNKQEIKSDSIVQTKKTVKKDIGTQDLSEIKVETPMPGTLYLTKSEGADNFVKHGDFVEKGDVLYLVEAMKMFNDVKAPSSGYVCFTDNVKKGDRVDVGDVFITITSEKPQ